MAMAGILDASVLRTVLRCHDDHGKKWKKYLVIRTTDIQVTLDIMNNLRYIF